MGYQAWAAYKLEPYFTVFVDDSEVTESLLQHTQSVTIEHRHEQGLTCRIVLRDSTLEFVDLNIFARGARWVVLLGWRSDHRPFGPFEVSAYQMKFGADGVATITVDLQDATKKLNSEAKWRSWEGRTLGDIVQTVAEENGLGYQIEDGDKFVASEDFPIMQAGFSDGMLLKQISERFGYRLEVRDGNILFTQRRANTDVDEPKLLAWRIQPRSLVSFEPSQRTYGGKGKKTGSVTGSMAGAATRMTNLDIKKGSIFDVVTDAVEGLTGITGEAEEVREGGPVTPTGDEQDDAAEKAKVTDSPDPGIWVFDGELPDLFLQKNPVAPERDTGESSSDEQEARKRAGAPHAGQKSDLALAKAELSVADPFIYKGDPCEVIGVGHRFSGRWLVAEFMHVYVKDAGLKSTLWLTKKGLGASSKTDAAVDKGAGGKDGAGSRENEIEFIRNWLFVGETPALIPQVKEKS